MIWKHRFLELAKHISTWSKDPKKKVGAVIVDPKTNKVKGMGYNGPPRNINDGFVLTQENKNDYIVHAEINAILQSGNCEGMHLYLYPFAPCNSCATIIINSGIKHVEVYNDIPKGKWKPAITIELFKQAGVTIKCGNHQN